MIQLVLGTRMSITTMACAGALVPRKQDFQIDHREQTGSVFWDHSRNQCSCVVACKERIQGRYIFNILYLFLTNFNILYRGLPEEPLSWVDLMVINL